MSVRLYMDVHVHSAITRGLRRLGVDVLTAQEDGARRLADADLLDRATALGRVLFTYDDDLLVEATRHQRAGLPFAGVIYIHEHAVSFGRCIEDLATIALAGEPEDCADQVISLPL